jgi:hypothetical protein
MVFCPSSATCSDAEVSSVGESGLADSSLGGVEEGLWPPSDPSITEETVEQGCSTASCVMTCLRASGYCTELEAMASDGEEAWLVAMEKGQLDETGYLPQRAGTSLTARQVS